MMIEMEKGKWLIAAILIASVLLLVFSITNLLTIREAAEGTYSLPSSWEDAVNLVLEKASAVEVRNVTGHAIAYFNRGEPGFDAAVNLIKNAEVVRQQPKKVVMEGRTVEVTIPYVWGVFLDFRLSSGLSMRFDYLPEGRIWFETQDFIYELVTREEDTQTWNRLITSSTAIAKCGNLLTPASPPEEFEGPVLLAEKDNVTMEVALSSKEVEVCDLLWIRMKLTGPVNKLWGSTRLTILRADGKKVYDLVLVEHMPTYYAHNISQMERVSTISWRAGRPGYPHDEAYLSDVFPGDYVLILERGTGDDKLRIETNFRIVENKYATLSDQEKQRIVDEVWSRLEAQNYTGQIIGWGYTDEGFEVLFKGKADPNIISIIREIIGDLPLKIYENATCKKL